MLALDGGGLRGMLTLQVLRAIETKLSEHRGRKVLLGDEFDYVAGTSTGAIIAACLALGFSVDQVEDLYRSLGPKLFTKRPLLERFWSLYDSDTVGRELEAAFGMNDQGRPVEFGDDKLHCLLLCVLQNATTDSAWPLSNCSTAHYNDRGRDDCNLDYPLWKVVRGSTAAPIYFAPEELEFGTKTFTFQDGGITSYNNPAFIQYTMATHPAYKLGWASGADNLLSVSIGTGTMPRTNVGRDADDYTVIQNVPNTIGFLMNAASVEQDRLCRLLGHCRHGAHIDREVRDLIAAPDSTAELFTYVRYNAELSDGGLADMGLEHIESKRVCKLDAVDAIDDLATIGKIAAQQVSLDHFAGFLG
jgi:uncharacterized protein